MLRLSTLSLMALATLTTAYSASARLEDSLAITNPRVLETLSQRRLEPRDGLGLARFLDPSGQTDAHLSNQNLFKLPAFKFIVEDIEKEIKSHAAESALKRESAGVGVGFYNRLFDKRFLQFDRARFALIGVVSRLDKAYLDPATCGEVRLIYRLAYNVFVNNDPNKATHSRLPMTINVVLNAKSPTSPLTCQEIAQRWNNLVGVLDQNTPIRQIAEGILAADGALAPELRDPALVKQIEINMQLSRTAAGSRRDWGGNATYLLKVYRWNETKTSLMVSHLDNQVDPKKASEFYAWLFDREHKTERLKQLDQGTIDIPAEFLATRGQSIAPGGLSRVANYPLWKSIPDTEIEKQLKDVGELINIKSVEGFKQRLNDISCTGCHQTRSIGGFHFMGQDPLRWNERTGKPLPLYPGNALSVPASGHFFADMERRRQVLYAYLGGRTPDFTTGFASRPQAHVQFLKQDGLGVLNGHGSICYKGRDASFINWTCAQGLRCEALHESPTFPGLGMCASISGKQIGDPLDAGKVTILDAKLGKDKYEDTTHFALPSPGYMRSRQVPTPGKTNGGFPGGSIILNLSDSGCNEPNGVCYDRAFSRHPEARWGALPGGAEGFNACLTKPDKTFEDCVKQYSRGVGLRACDRMNPCREDYICVEGMRQGLDDAGVCVPPYFLFQFRVDGHPVRF